MGKFLTIPEAANTLGLHPQTVYRKCQKNEIPSVRFGRTLRIPEDQLEGQKLQNIKQTSIPSFMKTLFWEYETTQLKSTDSIVIERILELGDLPEWRWLSQNVDSHQIQNFLKNKGKRRLSPKNFAFWSNLFGVKNGNQNPSKNPTGSLGKTGWR